MISINENKNTSSGLNQNLSLFKLLIKYKYGKSASPTVLNQLDSIQQKASESLE